MKVNMHEAKSQLSKLGKLAWEGEEIVIAKAGEPYLRLEPYRKSKTKRKSGVLKGQIWIAPDFDETPQEVIDSFWNSKIFPDEDE
ncbi:MAG: hypothetical protein OXF97_10960 [Nitrospira sp.]|nr:hypothetical protein [Nitrospira sp.]MCY4613570.1 hypothetical protein [Nitrospira sp.]